MNNRLINAAAAALLSGLCMTGCGTGRSSEISVVESSQTELQSKAETSANSGQTAPAPAPVPTSDEDASFDAAMDELDAVASAMASNDGERFVELLNVRKMVDLQLDVQELSNNGRTIAQEERDRAYEEVIASLPVESGNEPAEYTLGTPEKRDDIAVLASEVWDDISGSEMGADLSEADAKVLQEKMHDLFWLDGVYVVPVTLKSPSADEHTVSLYLMHDSSGWHPDGTKIPMMFGYATRMRITASNDAAATLRYALISVITDLSAENQDITLLDGEYEVSGTDFENAQAPESHETKDDMLAYMLYEAPFYYKDAIFAGNIKFRIANGDITLLALEYGEIPDLETNHSVAVYGTAPRKLSVAAYRELTSLEDAAAFAGSET